MDERQIREATVNLAISYLGVKEGSEEHKKLVDLYNSIRPLPRGYKLSYKDSWCAAWISDLMYTVDMDFSVPAECSCYYMMENAKAKGNWRNADDYHELLQEGDIIMYNWDNIADPDHVGMFVSYIDEACTIAKIIEGNKDDAVGYRYITIGDPCVMGFILPAYHEHIEIEADEPVEPDVYENIMNWNWDDKGWWYPYGKKKGQYHRNNAVRIDGNMYFFDAEGYCVKNPKVTTDNTGAFILIEGERVQR